MHVTFIYGEVFEKKTFENSSEVLLFRSSPLHAIRSIEFAWNWRWDQYNGAVNIYKTNELNLSGVDIAIENNMCREDGSKLVYLHRHVCVCTEIIFAL